MKHIQTRTIWKPIPVFWRLIGLAVFRAKAAFVTIPSCRWSGILYLDHPRCVSVNKDFQNTAMCGRYVSKIDADVERHFNLTKVPFDFSSYNVAPGRNVPVVRGAETGERELVLMRWGLIPHWAKEERIGYKMINARAETVDTKPAFRQPFKRHRCLIPANGFYEWRKTQSGKVPYFIHPRDDSVMGFAGLWDVWTNPGGEHIESCTIITTAANAVIKPLHDRMPLIISPDDYGVWLTGNVNEASGVVGMSSSFELEAYPVSTRVNKPANDDPGCIERVA